MKNNFNANKWIWLMFLFVVSTMSYADVAIDGAAINFHKNNHAQQSFLNAADSERGVWKDINFHIDNSLSEVDFLQQALQEKTNDDAVYHVFSHGKPGQLFLNGKWAKAKEIVTFLRQNITPDTKEIYLYGCNFARGDIGGKALAYLAQSLQLKIAASNNITGQNGDWVLENSSVDMTAVFAGYGHSLQDSDGDSILDVNDLDDDNDGILDVDECSEVITFFTPTGISMNPMAQSYTTSQAGSTFTLVTSGAQASTLFNGPTQIIPNPSNAVLYPDGLHYMEAISEAYGTPALNLTIDDAFPDFNGDDAVMMR